MTPTTVIAIYAAVVATAGLGWQIWLWAHRRRTHVTVDVFHSLEEKPVYYVSMYDPPAPVEYQYELTVTVRNRGEETEYVSSIGLDGADDRTIDDEERRELRPRSAVEWRTRVQHHPEFPWDRPFHGIATLESNAVFESELQKLDPEILEACN